MTADSLGHRHPLSSLFLIPFEGAELQGCFPREALQSSLFFLVSSLQVRSKAMVGGGYLFSPKKTHFLYWLKMNRAQTSLGVFLRGPGFLGDDLLSGKTGKHLAAP